MISLETWKIKITLQKLPKNVSNLGKIIVATGFEKLTKVQLIAQSGHTGHQPASQRAIFIFQQRRRWWMELRLSSLHFEFPIQILQIVWAFCSLIKDWWNNSTHKSLQMGYF